MPQSCLTAAQIFPDKSGYRGIPFGSAAKRPETPALAKD